MSVNTASRHLKLNSAVQVLVQRLGPLSQEQTGVIPWSAPVPAFGDPSIAAVATLGLNPSNREFVDVDGIELSAQHRRFHTLSSLGLRRWSEASTDHVQQIIESCCSYFHRNPYDAWFRQLDLIISGTGCSYYTQDLHACHLDLIPYATASKWNLLTRAQRTTLLEIAGDTLALLLEASSIRLIVLNGASVVGMFRNLANVNLIARRMPNWSLRRGGVPKVVGISYVGTTKEIMGVQLGRSIAVLGFNHNLQSSFGVTSEIRYSIARWISREAAGASAT